jgi:hypothetical protein
MADIANHAAKAKATMTPETITKETMPVTVPAKTQTPFAE